MEKGGRDFTERKTASTALADTVFAERSEQVEFIVVTDIFIV